MRWAVQQSAAVFGPAAASACGCHLLHARSRTGCRDLQIDSWLGTCMLCVAAGGCMRSWVFCEAGVQVGGYCCLLQVIDAINALAVGQPDNTATAAAGAVITDCAQIRKGTHMPNLEQM